MPPEVTLPCPSTLPTYWEFVLQDMRPPVPKVRVLSAAMPTVMLTWFSKRSELIVRLSATGTTRPAAPVPTLILEVALALAAVRVLMSVVALE